MGPSSTTIPLTLIASPIGLPAAPIIQGFDPFPSILERSATLHLNILGVWTEIEWTFAFGPGSSAMAWPAQASTQAGGSTYTTTTQDASLGLGPLPIPNGLQHLSVIVRNGAASAHIVANFTLVASGLSSVKVHPSPWRSDLHTGHDITFDNLPPGSTVKIFTVSAHWVATRTADTNGQATWNLKTDGGDNVASGIYLYLITDSQGDKAHGKFGVIR